MAGKAKYKKWLERENLILLEGWARNGLTDEELAERMEINVATLYTWKSKHAPIREALKKGKEVVDFAVENALLKRALKGDTTACIFWLKNRKPMDWRDKQVVDVDREVMDKLDSIMGDIDGVMSDD